MRPRNKHFSSVLYLLYGFLYVNKCVRSDEIHLLVPFTMMRNNALSVAKHRVLGKERAAVSGWVPPVGGALAVSAASLTPRLLPGNKQALPLPRALG